MAKSKRREEHDLMKEFCAHEIKGQWKLAVDRISHRGEQQRCAYFKTKIKQRAHAHTHTPETTDSGDSCEREHTQKQVRTRQTRREDV